MKDAAIASFLAAVNIWATLVHLDLLLKVVIGFLTVLILVAKTPSAIKTIRNWFKQ